jgi:hypothetical protein
MNRGNAIFAGELGAVIYAEEQEANIDPAVGLTVLSAEE